MLLADYEGTRDNINLINLAAIEMAHYGFYGDASNLTVTSSRVGNPGNPAVNGTYNFHGYRFYGGNITVTNCTANNVRNTGLWTLTGSATVNGFSGNVGVLFGPNPSFTDSSPSERLYNSTFSNIAITNAPSSYLNYLNGIRAELGTFRAAMFNVTSQSPIVIGQMSFLNQQAGPVPPRLLNRIHWVDVSPTPVKATETTPTPEQPLCIGDDVYSADCLGDVGGAGQLPNGVVDSDDLVAVILGWGNCPAPATTPTQLGQPCPANLSPCYADIVPQAIGNNFVDADDLVAVILNWGPCNGGGGGEAMPQSIQDCVDKATQEYGTGSSPAKTEFIEKCVLALCEAGIINCD